MRSPVHAPVAAACVAAPLLLGLLGACSCGEGERPRTPSGVPLALLARTADLAIEEPGELLPIPRAQGGDGFGAAGLAGWSKWTEERTGGLAWVRANQERAVLLLDATDPAARELRLVAWAEGAAEPRALAVALNGAGVGRLELGPEPAEHALAVPASRWRRGANELVLRLEPGAPGALALAAVRWGTPRRVAHEPAAGEARLPSGTGLVFRVEAPLARALRVRGRAQGPGTLALAFGAMDPALGTAVEGRGRAAERSLAAGPFDLCVPVAEVGPGILVVELVWHGEADAALALEALDLEEERALPRPPIVMVSIDTLAARHLSLHGYGRPTTPVLERLAREAVVFEHCVANAPWTLPSYLALFSGLYPRAHLVELEAEPGVALADHDRWQLAPNRWTLAEAVRSRGYATGGIVDSHWLYPAFRFDQGFDIYSTGPSEVPIEDPAGGIELVVDEILGWLDRRTAGGDARPFFVFAHALDCHGPYWPEAPWEGRFEAAPETVVLPARGAFRTYRAIPMWMAMTVAPAAHRSAVREAYGGASAEDVPYRMAVEPLVARYDETILGLDAALGRLFDGLRERGLWDEALVIVTADHGESFAHRHFDHGEPWEDVVHVPLVMKLPGGRGAGRRVADDVQLVDVYPTVLELLGLPHEGRGLHGRSLLALARGEASAPRPAYCNGGFVRQGMLTLGGWKLIERRPALESGDAALLTHPLVPDAWLAQHFPELLEHALTEQRLEALRARPDFAARIAELRELLRGPYVELYDLAEDPAELRDVAARHPERVAELTRLLRAEEAREEEARGRARASAAAPLDAAALQALRGIGYGGAGEPPR